MNVKYTLIEFILFVAIYLRSMVTTFSALIVCYKRKNYILEAVKSIINQDYRQESVEIVVVKAFLDEYIDKELNNYNVKSIFCDSPSNGKAISIGLRSCRNEIICLLDDDDIFTKSKFLEISKIFEKNPEIELSINSYFMINKSGNEIIENRFAENIDDDIPDAINLEKCNLTNKKFRKFDIFFNTSRYSLRNRDLVKLSEYLINIYYGVDHAIVMFYIFESMKFAVTNKKLTAYRIHEQNISRIKPYSKSFDKLKSQLDKEIDSLRNIQSFRKNRDIAFGNHIELLVLYLNLKRAYIRGSRSEIFMETTNLLKFYILHSKKMKTNGFYPRLNLYVYRDILSLPLFLLVPTRMSKYRLTRFY